VQGRQELHLWLDCDREGDSAFGGRGASFVPSKQGRGDEGSGSARACWERSTRASGAQLGWAYVGGTSSGRPQAHASRACETGPPACTSSIVHTNPFRLIHTPLRPLCLLRGGHRLRGDRRVPSREPETPSATPPTRSRPTPARPASHAPRTQCAAHAMHWTRHTRRRLAAGARFPHSERFRPRTLPLPPLQVRRARFSALIPRDIFHALANLVPPDQRQVSRLTAGSPSRAADPTFPRRSRAGGGPAHQLLLSIQLSPVPPFPPSRPSPPSAGRRRARPHRVGLASWRCLHPAPDSHAAERVRGAGRHHELRPVPVPHHVVRGAEGKEDRGLRPGELATAAPVGGVAPGTPPPQPGRGAHAHRPFFPLHCFAPLYRVPPPRRRCFSVGSGCPFQALLTRLVPCAPPSGDVLADRARA
jgi:hypothetical protein